MALTGLSVGCSLVMPRIDHLKILQTVRPITNPHYSFKSLARGKAGGKFAAFGLSGFSFGLGSQP